MSTIAEILKANNGLCMDDEGDRLTLAKALKKGLVKELRDLADSYYDSRHSPGIDCAADRIEMMADD